MNAAAKPAATITVDVLATYRGKFVSVSEGMSGHFAVIYWWNKPDGGFWEPWNTGFGRYATEDEARVEAIALSESEGVPYLMPAASESQAAS